MNKNVSLAIEKAVGSINQKNQNEIKNNGPKKPDLFSLSGDTELFQNDKGITIKIDRSRDSNLTDFGKATLQDRYLGQNESFQDLFASCLLYTSPSPRDLRRSRMPSSA